MKTKNNVQFFFRAAAWSWLVFGVVSVVIELVRPEFIDYVLPIWIIFVVAALFGVISIIHKP